MPVPIDSWELRQGLALIFHSLSGFGSRGRWDKSMERGARILKVLSSLSSRSFRCRIPGDFIFS